MVDNGSSHRGAKAAKRLRTDWPQARLIHLPVHASWLNQIEIVFSVIQRKVLTPNDIGDTDQLADRLAAFETWFNATAHPFNWRFSDLTALLARLDKPALPAAA